jgi:hypothetical protein
VHVHLEAGAGEVAAIGADSVAAPPVVAHATKINMAMLSRSIVFILCFFIIQSHFSQR